MAVATAEPAEAVFVEELVDAERLRFASSTSRLIAWASLGVLVVVLVLWAVFRQYTQLLAVAVFTVPISVGAAVFPYFRDRRRPRSGIYVMLTCLVVSIIAIAFFLPATVSAITMGLTLVVLMAYLLLGDRPGRWLIAICSVALAFCLIVPNVWDPGWFPSLRGEAGWVLGAVTGMAAILGYSIILRSTVMGQVGSYRESQRAKREIERRAAAEQDQREHLQATVEQYVTFMSQVARGDLAARLSLGAPAQETDDPLLVLGHNLNEMVASLQQMTTQVRDVAANLNASSAEILAATAQQAAGASEQSASIAQASATITEVRSSAEQTAHIAEGVSDLALRTAEISQAGRQSVTETITGMQEVRQKVETIAHNILALSERTQAIGQIIAAVSELAAQSNMLALNAAVEAARAGEAGQGFAVVAAEVRALAEQSRAATGQVKELLSEIQSGVNTAVMATEEGMKRSDAGMKLAGEAGGAIDKLSESVGESTQAAAQIAAAAAQQVTGVTQISQAMQSIDQATAQNAAGARQVELAAQSLNDLATQMRTLVEQYRL